MKLLHVESMGNIENVVPWQDNLLPTVPDRLLRSHPYSDRIVIIQEDIEELYYFDHRADPVRAFSRAGYAFDYASIPTRALARIFRYNCNSLAHGARAHDIGFQRQYGGVNFQACLLREIALYHGYSRRKMKFVERAVRGNIAKKLYSDRCEFDLINSTFCEMGRVNG
ncbi:MAG: hypothetical protein GY774_00265 [Planctomycetes bacterium]|nr:hypothetical protein [Planctomycetota bacterium]